ncbi:hypothetical protein XA68_14991 [Ophiocordyceps unilateralis]|uniref:Uncharacterized protein n=1 Tax=Ophiocordyceps unilateralis TaxID=268505 RepID=A0A2A9P872_OPHUN|nr:hypothetical protein XA68_14991 [Ophiocordyceps unilateralis]
MGWGGRGGLRGLNVANTLGVKRMQTAVCCRSRSEHGLMRISTFNSQVPPAVAFQPWCQSNGVGTRPEGGEGRFLKIRYGGTEPSPFAEALRQGQGSEHFCSFGLADF